MEARPTQTGEGGAASGTAGDAALQALTARLEALEAHHTARIDGLHAQVEALQAHNAWLVARVAALEDGARMSAELAQGRAVVVVTADAGALAAGVAAVASPAAAPPAVPAPAPARFRPGATNQWDRMPAEIKGIIMGHSTLLTRVELGGLLRAELADLTADERARLWSEVFETEWPGDLRMLPGTPMRLEFLGIRSREMLRRVRQAGLGTDDVLLRVAVRNGWADLLDFRRPDRLAAAAARDDALWLIKELVDERKAVAPTLQLAGIAAASGSLGVVRFLHERMPSSRAWDENVMNQAAASGNLDLVVFLHQNRTEGCTHLAMDQAAERGHTHIVRWLAENRTEGCSFKAVKYAAVGGHAEMLALLRERFPREFEVLPSYELSRVWQLDVLKQLHALGRLPDPASILAHLPWRDDASDSIRWLCSTFGLAVTQEMFETAYRAGSLRVARWMATECPGIVVDEQAVRYLAQRGHGAMLNWVVSRNRAWLAVIADCAVARDDPVLVEWLSVRHPECVTQAMLQDACRKGFASIVVYLLDNVSGVEWDLDAAGALASGRSAAPILDLLYAYAERRAAVAVDSPVLPK